MVIAQKSGFDLCAKKGVSASGSKFLESVAWKGCTNFRMECVTNWTKLFATDEVVYNDPIIQNFLSYLDLMSCSADTYVSLGGSNGCADQLTNWDGTKKVGLGALTKRKVHGLLR